MRIEEHWIECQDCGIPLHRLTAAQQQRVASEPYNFIMFCQPCGQYRLFHPEI